MLIVIYWFSFKRVEVDLVDPEVDSLYLITTAIDFFGIMATIPVYEHRPSMPTPVPANQEPIG